MPEKSPDLWATALAWLGAFLPQLYAPGLSVTIAVLRVIYGGGSKRQMVLEGALCGLVTLSLAPLLEWMGLPPKMATFAGAVVGFIGVEKLREWAIKAGQRRVEE